MQSKNKVKHNQSTDQATIQTYNDISLDNDYNVDTDITLDSVIHYLTQLKIELNQTSQSKLSLEQTINKNERLHKQVTDLEKQLNRTQKQFNTIKDNYQIIVKNIDRSKKMTVLNDEQRTFQ